MKRNTHCFRLLLILALMSIHGIASAQQTQQEVIDLIIRVNDHWQQNHPAETSAFWDHAVYHTGNIEVYTLLDKTKDYPDKASAYLNYSRRWAEHNHYQGATETDPEKWEYKTYGEDQQHVLFADWQCCFQTYLDLYKIAEDSAAIARQKIYEQAAKDGIMVDLPQPRHWMFTQRTNEVMGYLTASPANDFWWWCDALYMAMPVLTKMAKMNWRDVYLDKLYACVQYTDSIMLDKSGLYFRDAKYVYPKHKTRRGKKDFWARGNGWVLAGLAKVLKDMSTTYSHYDFFKEKFQKLAESAVALQQTEGYWTRSMADPRQAPGPETSGTALLTYGILWGVNNKVLDKDKYKPVIDRAWRYLTTTALQKDGSVGYVQPIGENSAPNQKVNSRSETNFGTAAFLLAACEYYRYLK